MVQNWKSAKKQEKGQTGKDMHISLESGKKAKVEGENVSTSHKATARTKNQTPTTNKVREESATARQGGGRTRKQLQDGR